MLAQNKPIPVLMLCFIMMLFFNIPSSFCQNDIQIYHPTWESLKQHVTPDWFQDAKFGIYTHWGVYSVPAYENEWYPRLMYDKSNRRNIFRHHKTTYGEPWLFGYKDFIPMFQAKKFNADEWADLFLKAGAQFAGPVAEHHDGFAMWDCAFSQWDAKDKGPKRDILGELAQAIRKRGMKFVTSFHHGFNWKYYEPSYELNHKCDTQDLKYAGIDGLYPPPHEKGAPESEEFLEDWLAKIKEVIDKYQPDYLWFDFGWKEPTFEKYKKSFLAYYYNKAEEWGRKVVVSYKGDHLPIGTAVLDLERGKIDTLTDFTWITDTSVDYKSWCYISTPEYKTVNILVDNLIDRVSKNGNLLLNIGPKADGTIPEAQKELLLGIGKWLEVNGEAIYGTRPWILFGEGPTRGKGGSFSESNQQVQYTAEDIRFTRKGNVLYAIVLDWPQDKLVIKSLKSTTQISSKGIASVSLLGSRATLEWSRDKNGLAIVPPTEKPCQYAYVFKIDLIGNKISQ